MKVEKIIFPLIKKFKPSKRTFIQLDRLEGGAPFLSGTSASCSDYRFTALWRKTPLCYEIDENE